MRGIDVSVYQGNINWQKVKSDGVEFAIIKATQGRAVNSASYLFTDRYFAVNVAGAYNAGVKIGAYHYLTARTVKEAHTEADHFIATLQPFKAKIKLWAAVDVEDDKYLPKNKKLLTDIVCAFCETVKAAGFAPTIYTNPNYLVYRLNDISKYDLWLALWRDKSLTPTNYKNMKVWQYGLDKVDGVIGDVDSNFGYFTIPLKSEKPTTPTLSKGDTVKVTNNIIYGTTRRFGCWFPWYDVIDITGDRVVIGRNKTITAAVAAANLKKI